MTLLDAVIAGLMLCQTVAAAILFARVTDLGKHLSALRRRLSALLGAHVGRLGEFGHTLGVVAERSAGVAEKIAATRRHFGDEAVPGFLITPALIAKGWGWYRRRKDVAGPHGPRQPVGLRWLERIGILPPVVVKVLPLASRAAPVVRAAFAQRNSRKPSMAKEMDARAGNRPR